MIKRIVFFISIYACIASVHAQVAMGGWRTHFAYNQVELIDQSENKIFAVSEGSLFSIDKRDNSMEFYSKINGLSGTTIANIQYSPDYKFLLIAYNDGNLDFLSADGVYNLPDYYNKQMNVDKSINHILFSGTKGYLSCNFGVISLNLNKKEIYETYYIGENASDVKVLNTTIHNGILYAISEDHIYYADASSKELLDFKSWSLLQGLPGSKKIQKMISFNNYLILLRDGQLYIKTSDSSWDTLSTDRTFNNIKTSGNYLFAFTPDDTYFFDKALNVKSFSGITSLTDGIYDNSANKYWLCGNLGGVAEYSGSTDSPKINVHDINGPIVNIPYFMKFAGERLFVLPGGKFVAPFERPANIMIFENNTWKNITQAEIQQQLEEKIYHGERTIRVEDFTAIAVDPDDKSHFIITGASSGFYEFENDELTHHYDYLNSNIEKALNLESDFYQWVDNGIYDANKNLWFTNDLVGEGLKIRLSDGQWDKFDAAGLRSTQSLGRILISSLNPNHKWILSRRHNPGICIFDDNGTIENKSDDKSVFYSSFNYLTSDGIQTISSTRFYCMTQDNTGAIWVGTDSGPIVFNNPSNAFKSDFMCSRIIIPRNDGTGQGDYLLEEQQINAIAIDGANRKWIGTNSSGIYLMSENGQETIQHFTTKNSPLLSNEILSIVINPVSGEVFIGTANGLISYQSDAAEPRAAFKKVYAYPNPVREDFTGVITITGLVENTTLKITDVAGNLVFETTSNGSIATWDGRNKYGQKVSTGVYLVICVNEDGSQNTTTKILVIN